MILFVALPGVIEFMSEWVRRSESNQVLFLAAVGVVFGLGFDHYLLWRGGGKRGGARKRLGAKDRIARAFRNSLRRRVQCEFLTAQVQELNPDVLHLHDVTALPVGLRYRKQGGTAKLIFDSHELYEDIPNASKYHRKRSKNLQAQIAPMLSGFITINDSIAAKLVKRYPQMPEPVLIMNAAVCPPSEAVDDGRLRRAAGLGPDTRILLYQGGFAAHRGLDKLVEAGPLLPEGWALVMMGWGKYEAFLRRKAALLDPQGTRVRFIERAKQEELVHWTAGADLGVIPYVNIGLNHWFCTPNKLWEYPAAGVPILASPFPELRRIVEGERVGSLLDDPVTPEGIASVVAGIDDEMLADLKLRCRSFITRDNWSVYAARLLGLYEEVIGLPNGAAGHEDAVVVTDSAGKIESSLPV